MMDRNTITALLLIGVILILTPYYMELVSPTPSGLGDSLTFEPAKIVPSEELSTTVSPAQSDTSFRHLTIDSIEEQTATIETDLYIAKISSRGGGLLTSFILKKHIGPDSMYVDLINGKNRENLSLQFKNLDAETINLSSPWHVNRSFHSEFITSPTTLKYYTIINDNKEISKTLTFYPDSYLIDINIDLTSCKNVILSGTYFLAWRGGLPVTEKTPKDDQMYFNGYVYQGGEIEETKAKSGEKIVNVYNGNTDWTAIRTKYFISSFIPEDPSSVVSASIAATVDDREEYSMILTLPSNLPFYASLFLGPLEYDRIVSVGKNLDEVMNFGWFFIRPISKGVLWLLKNIHIYIPNYGVVLIIFSILVKIVVYPLTKKSYQSTQAMQALQPEIASMREKYKNNPQKLNQATMQLYKKRGVNPLGGCLPMLLQMPLLFALFTVFRSTIELRGEPFIFWISDLSSPDIIFNLPFNIPIYGDYVCALPILMAGSMFIQQKMMSGGAVQQQQQKLMQYFMMVFFFLIFNSFPSGLNLYYTLFNVLSILQQKYLVSPSK